MRGRALDDWMTGEQEGSGLLRRIKAAGMPQKQEQALRLYVFSRMGFKRVGQELGVSREAARELIRKGAKRLQQGPANQGLRGLL